MSVVRALLGQQCIVLGRYFDIALPQLYFHLMAFRSSHNGMNPSCSSMPLLVMRLMERLGSGCNTVM